MSDNERPELHAFRELESLVHHLVEELASFRRRALRAEARLKQFEDGGAALDAPLPAERVAELERENADLKEMVDGAKTRVKAVLDRVHFLRQQAQRGEA
jgi:hypothetical protein